jgi:hypothetical protein
VLTWKKLGPAFMASVVLEGGEMANIVVVAEFGNPKGAALVRKDASGADSTTHFPEAATLLRPADIIETYCMQERAFGQRHFPEPVTA